MAVEALSESLSESLSADRAAGTAAAAPHVPGPHLDKLPVPGANPSRRRRPRPAAAPALGATAASETYPGSSQETLRPTQRMIMTRIMTRIIQQRISARLARTQTHLQIPAHTHTLPGSRRPAASTTRRREPRPGGPGRAGSERAVAGDGVDVADGLADGGDEGRPREVGGEEGAHVVHQPLRRRPLAVERPGPPLPAKEGRTLMMTRIKSLITSAAPSPLRALPPPPPGPPRARRRGSAEIFDYDSDNDSDKISDNSSDKGTESDSHNDSDIDTDNDSDMTLQKTLILTR